MTAPRIIPTHHTDGTAPALVTGLRFTDAAILGYHSAVPLPYVLLRSDGGTGSCYVIDDAREGFVHYSTVDGDGTHGPGVDITPESSSLFNPGGYACWEVVDTRHEATTAATAPVMLSRDEAFALTRPGGTMTWWAGETVSARWLRDGDGDIVRQTFSSISGENFVGRATLLGELSTDERWTVDNSAAEHVYPFEGPGIVALAEAVRVAGVGGTIRRSGEPFAVLPDALIQQHGDRAPRPHGGVTRSGWIVNTMANTGDATPAPSGDPTPEVVQADEATTPEDDSPARVIPRTSDEARAMLATLSVFMPDSPAVDALKRLVRWLPGGKVETMAHAFADDRSLCNQYENVVVPVLGWTPRRAMVSSVHRSPAEFDQLVEYAERTLTGTPAEIIASFVERYDDGGEVNDAIVDWTRDHLESHKVPYVNELLESLGMTGAVPVSQDYYVDVNVTRVVTMTTTVRVLVTAESSDEAMDMVDSDQVADAADSADWDTAEDLTCNYARDIEWEAISAEAD